MKKIIILFILISMHLSVMAQNAKYISIMEQNIAILDTTKNILIHQDLANKFERIANAEKKEWLPYYYAAFCYARMTSSNNKGAIDNLCDKADQLINKADSLSPQNSEIYSMKARITIERATVNPIASGQKYSSQAAAFREKSKELDPTNPRPYYLEGAALYYIPKGFGGGKDKAKVVFEKALTYFENFKPESNIAPHWGKEGTLRYIKKCDEK